MQGHSGHQGYGKCRRGGWHIGGSDSLSRDDFSRNFSTCGVRGVDNDSSPVHATMRHAFCRPMAASHLCGTGFSQLVPFRFDGIETRLWILDLAGFLDANRL
jgi:hypothetical protein